MNRKLNVNMIVSGFPSKENPHHGVFNKIAAESISKLVSLTVIQLRYWKPGKKFYEENFNNKYKHITISVPYIPIVNNYMLHLTIDMYYRLGNKKIAELRSADIIHSVGASVAGILGAKWSKKFSVKHVLQIIGSDVNTELKGILSSGYFPEINKYINAVGCNSKALMRNYKELMNKPDQIEVIYRGVDLEKYKMSKSAQSGIVFLFLGGIPLYKGMKGSRNIKGGITLMNVWMEYEKYFYENKCRLIFAGPDSDNEVTTKWTASLKHPGIVTLRGKINPDELQQTYTKCSVVIIPSLEEGLPNVLLEAGASGKAVIASNTGGIPEVIENGVNGLLFTPGNESELSSLMFKIAKDEKLVYELGTSLRKKIVTDFSSESFAGKYMDLYNKSLAA